MNHRSSKIKSLNLNRADKSDDRQSSSKVTSTPIAQRKSMVDDDLSPVQIRCTQDGGDEFDVIWDWNSPQSRVKKSFKQRKRTLNKSPQIPRKIPPKNNLIPKFTSLLAELEKLNKSDDSIDLNDNKTGEDITEVKNKFTDTIEDVNKIVEDPLRGHLNKRIGDNNRSSEATNKFLETTNKSAKDKIKFSEVTSEFIETTNKYTGDKNKFIGNTNKFTDRLCEETNKFTGATNYVEARNKFTGIPNKYTKMQNKYTELSNKCTEVPNKRTEVPNKYTEVQNKFTDVPHTEAATMCTNKFTETDNKCIDNSFMEISALINCDDMFNDDSFDDDLMKCTQQIEEAFTKPQTPQPKTLELLINKINVNIADDSFDAILEDYTEDDIIKFSQTSPEDKCTTPVKNSRTIYRTTSTPVRYQKCNKPENMLPRTKSAEVCGSPKANVITFSPEEIEKKRLEAKAKLELKKAQKEMEKRRQEALERLNKNRLQRIKNK